MRIPTVVALVAVLFAATTAIALAAGSGLPNIGSPKMKSEPVYRGYYDKHIDTYMLTDVSNKAQATAMHINYSASLGKIKGLPLQYFVKGRAAKGQLTVFGSEPGEDDYNPLWEEVWVALKHAPLELRKLLARIEAQLLRECATGPLVGVERVGLAARAIQREHQLAAKPLAPWVLTH